MKNPKKLVFPAIADPHAAEIPESIWSCYICGPHPNSGPMWCGAGCGSDFIEMSKVENDS